MAFLQSSSPMQGFSHSSVFAKKSFSMVFNPIQHLRYRRERHKNSDVLNVATKYNYSRNYEAVKGLLIKNCTVGLKHSIAIEGHYLHLINFSQGSNQLKLICMI